MFRVFTGYGNLWPEIQDYLQQVYVAPQVTILGDGAAWIQAGASYIPDSQQVLDGFHAMKYLRKIVGTGSIDPLYDAILADDPEGFRQEVTRKQRRSPQRKAGIATGMKYVLNHWQEIRRWLQAPAQYASSTEGHVSHILSERPSSRGMVWSPKGAECIARLRTLAENGGNVQDYVVEHLTKTPAVMSDVGPQEMEKQLYRRRMKCCAYDAEHHFPMLGSEGALHGRWMKDIQNGGYQRIS